MNTRRRAPNPPPHALGRLLRNWRDVRGVSQLDLSLDAGISQRQISFIESGRSVPGRDTLLTLAQTLDVPLRERNALLLAAGYAPMYSEAPWDAQEMHGVIRALERVVRQHEPFPAIVMDRHWNVLMTNDAAPRFFGCFIDMAARDGPRNLLRLMFDPRGMQPFVADWGTVSRSLLQRVHRESVGRVIDDETRRLLDDLLASPDAPSDWNTPLAPAAAPSLPVIPIGFVHEGVVLRYFSLVTTVGTPQSAAAQELRMECMFPADDATDARHRQLLDAHAPVR
ncbi:TPA: helix-turn-helix transcriptional regulator [Burkholderia cenocepacia]|jgi:transcriptional regulator with XRE-family HTH domain|uniref:helix-turn-helix domain-containing protein n=1 Tax=Burkholderia cenocepacia TaxID=95486 RepID=UPI00158F3919|nr:helix-turn-helix transcriptional regulator [Burkholderia cenocepacia]MBR8198836.1 helix-turn-helix transcriptional regulator [Burkholderia cenocepacia]MBR8413332.1 helix-turn-helix transcriptional regulator [Burkholderia cenocepacia]MCA8087922.1 helix-turn-helix transcriptional regulator [Burkholderia cenocepacia]HDV6327194.1 helix-turn-helix transcriptional regulator [Burkholderia cenocepacia]HDV6352583.1 helix-turn-helix transcriptional regulator [Burkholderia cenocepacia]